MFEYQNVLICPDVFEYLSGFYSGNPNYEDIDLKSYKQNLKLKCLILDKSDDENGVYLRIKNIINSSSDIAKHKLELIIEEFIKSKRIKFVENLSNNAFSKSEDHNYIFNLALSSKTKIINSQLEILFYKNKINEFEIFSIEDFTNPPSDSSIFNIRRDVDLNKNDKFNIFETLHYYWINTESLVIEDDYLRKKSGQFPKLIKLIKYCKNLKELKIFTFLSDKNQQTKEFVSAQDFESKIEELTGIELLVEDKQVGERHYITDFFDLHFGKGLDFFNENSGYNVWRDKVTITIRQRADKELN